MELRKATKQERKNLWGSSFHNTTIYATVDELTEIFGQENIGASSDDKTKHEWYIKDETDNRYFSVYDWKEYRNYPSDEMIEWHIGSKLTSEEEQAFADELKKRLSELRQRN